MFYNKKKSVLPSLLLLFILLGSCKKESAFRYPAKPEVTISAADSRLLNNTIHLVKDTVYILATNMTLANGQLLLIDAGTLVKVNDGRTIVIQAGATITATGTKDEPVIFTSSAGKGKQARFGTEGTWGGIQVLGNNTASSSGTLSYVRIEFARGLVLNNVSNQTILNHIQVSYSTVNSFDFIGSNCNAANLISYAATSTDFNITSGYKGNLQNILAYRYPSFASTALNMAGINIEGTNTEPAISNATIIGPELKYGINGNYTLGIPQRRAGIITSDNCKFHIKNSVVLGAPSQRQATNLSQTDDKSVRAYFLDSRNTAASLDSGRADITYTVFYQADSNTFYIPNRVYAIPLTIPVKYYNSNDLSNFLLRSKFNNEVYSTLDKFNLIDPFNYFDGIPNPFPNTTSPVLTGANFNDISITPVFTNSFFKPVTYRGALGADNWMQGWVNFIPLQTDYNN